MSYVRSWLLTGAHALLARCQTPSGAGLSDTGTQPEILSIDLTKGEARTPAWTRPAIDCSDETNNCVIVEGLFGISFPKKCSRATKALVWESTAGTIRVVAPAPHFGLPSGSYISEKFPNSLLLYRHGQGFYELRILNSSPFEEGFDPNSFQALYRLTLAGQDGLFVCR